MDLQAPNLQRLDPWVEQRFVRGAREATRFFGKTADVFQALYRLVDRLSELENPYAIVGAMALNAY